MTATSSEYPVKIENTEAFQALVAEIQNREDYHAPFAYAVGFATVIRVGDQQQMLEAWYPVVNATIEDKLENGGTAAILTDIFNRKCIKDDSGKKTGTNDHYPLTEDELPIVFGCFFPFLNDGKHHANLEVMKKADAALKSGRAKRIPIVTFIGNPHEGPKSVADAYLRLHLLSHRKVRPNTINLNGIFGILPNVSWTSEGPMRQEDLLSAQCDALINGREFKVYHQDKFPHLLDYVVMPNSIRIADGEHVRLGAYLGDGTTVMPAGAVNYNAGTEGPAMVEGRISQGVMVAENSDIGGGASIMGTLSGGGNEVISIGENCLLGALAGIGISLGSRCSIEAGLYIKASHHIYLGDEYFLEKYRDHPETKVGTEGLYIKARHLSGINDAVFRSNDLKKNRLEIIFNKNPNKLNAALHAPAPTPLLATPT